MAGSLIEGAIDLKTDEGLRGLVNGEGGELRGRASDEGVDPKGTPSVTEPGGVSSVHNGDRGYGGTQGLFNHTAIRWLRLSDF